MTRALPLCLFLVGCSSELAVRGPDAETSEGEPDVDGGDTADEGAVGEPFWLAVEPVVEVVDGDLILPQTFGPFVVGTGFELDLAPAVRVEGRVDARRVTPIAFAPLPDEAVDVSGVIRFTPFDGRAGLAGQGFQARVTNNEFVVDLVPGTWQVGVSPEVARVPAVVEALWIAEDQRLTLALDGGVPVWGRVVDDDGDPLPNTRVAAFDADGHSVAAVETDDFGFYELRLRPGAWTVEATPPVSARAPTRRIPLPALGTTGQRVDVGYANEDLVIVSGRAIDGAGDAVPGVRVRLTSRRLDGYVGGEASYTIEARSGSAGLFDALVPPGDYDLYVLPEASVRLAPLLISGLRVSETIDLGSLAMGGFRTLRADVLNPDGEPVADAAVRCVETAPGGRTWTTTTDTLGAFSLEVSDGSLACALLPGSADSDLAGLRIRTNAESFPGTITLSAGNPVGGVARIRRADGTITPLGRAVVRVLDAQGETRSLALTDNEGAFITAVSWDE